MLSGRVGDGVVISDFFYKEFDFFGDGIFL